MSDTIRPRSIRLESTTRCQLKCPSCSTAMGVTGKALGNGHLTFASFKSLMDANPHVMHVELSNWGEMFLNPELLEILRYAHEQGIALTASNGVNLNAVKRNVLEGLVKYRFRHMTCSIDGASQETYTKYRRRGNFHRVIQNIKLINTLKQATDSDFPLLRWQFVAFGHNEHEVEQAKTMADELGMEFYLKLSWDDEFSPVRDREKVRRYAEGHASSEADYAEKNGETYLQKMICSQLWNIPQLNWDGRVLGCCVNRWSDFGNAFEESLSKILNSGKLLYARRMLRGLEPAKDDIACTTCRYYKAIKETKNWMSDADIALYRNVYKMPYAFRRTGIKLASKVPKLARLYLKAFALK